MPQLGHTGALAARAFGFGGGQAMARFLLAAGGAGGGPSTQITDEGWRGRRWRRAGCWRGPCRCFAISSPSHHWRGGRQFRVRRFRAGSGVSEVRRTGLGTAIGGGGGRRPGSRAQRRPPGWRAARAA